MTGERFVADGLARAPPKLRERQVHADGVHVDVRQTAGGEHLLEAMRTEMADRRVERIDDVQQAHAAGAVGETNLARRGITRAQRVEREVRRRIADAQLVAGHREMNVALECFSRSNLLHGTTSPFRKRR